MKKETPNKNHGFLECMVVVFVCDMAWVSLPDLVYIKYTDITR